MESGKACVDRLWYHVCSSDLSLTGGIWELWHHYTCQDKRGTDWTPWSDLKLPKHRQSNCQLHREKKEDCLNKAIGVNGCEFRPPERCYLIHLDCSWFLSEQLQMWGGIMDVQYRVTHTKTRSYKQYITVRGHSMTGLTLTPLIKHILRFDVFIFPSLTFERHSSVKPPWSSNVTTKVMSAIHP